MSVSIENFVKTLYKYQQTKGLDTRPGSVAKALGITNAGATDMARKLAGKGLISYQKYKPLKLTEKGTSMALTILRRHRLWETFLYKTFDMSLHDIHREAERLEHQTSEFMEEAISKYLGHPEFDPHGDPIPDKNGKIKEVNHIPLSETEKGKKYIISRLISSDLEFFEFCEANDIKIGEEINILNQYESNQLTEVMIAKTKLILTDAFSNVIMVKNK